MGSAEAILAAVLLVAPPAEPIGDTLPAPVPDAWLLVLRPSLLTLAMDAEILDPREKGFVLGNDPGGDLVMLRGRYRELLAAPLLGEGERFPERKLINELLGVNRTYRNQLTARLAIDLVYSDEIRTAIAETDQLYQIWDTVRDATCPYFYVSVRRNALSLLRELIGPESFCSGVMPPPVPIWHFPREDAPQPDRRMRRMPER